jgi:hypothetical protein
LEMAFAIFAVSKSTILPSLFRIFCGRKSSH